MLLSAEDPNVILPDSELGLKYGFTSEYFDGYLWLADNESIIISLIVSLHEHEGNFRGLLDRLHKDYNVLVIHPFERMCSICEKYGMHYHADYDVYIITRDET